MRAAVVMMACVLVALSGCGDALEDALGAYEGEGKYYNVTSFGMVTTLKTVTLSVTPASSGGGVILGLDERCALAATLDGQSLQIASQTCEFEVQRSRDAWIYEGSGSVSGDTLTLELKGTYTRTYTDASGTPALEGRHELSFSGERQ